MGNLEEGQNIERTFTLSEANRLIPELDRHLVAIGQSKALLVRVKEEIKKASAKAHLGGGSHAGRVYITALEQMSEHLPSHPRNGGACERPRYGSLCFPPYGRSHRPLVLEAR